MALLLSRRIWRAWLLVPCGFHLANVLLLNISFGSQAVSYAVFAGLAFRPAPAWWRKVLLAATAAVGAWHVVSRLRGGGSAIFLVDSYPREVVWTLYLAIPACLFVLAVLAVSLWKPATLSRS